MANGPRDVLFCYALMATCNLLANYRLIGVYPHMMLVVVATIYCGSRLALMNAKEAARMEEEKKKAKESGGEVCAACLGAPGPLIGETMKTKDAYMFPVIGSIMLFSLYLIFKFFPKDYVNIVIKAYFFIIGVFILAQKGGQFLEWILPQSIVTSLTSKHYDLPNILLYIEQNIEKIPFCKKNSSSSTPATPVLAHTCAAKRNTAAASESSEGPTINHPLHVHPHSAAAHKQGIIDGQITMIALNKLDIIAIILSLVIASIYIKTEHFALSNLFGILFSIQGIELLSLGTYFNGVVLLSGLFLYDIFWVFGTDVMVTVAKNFDAPIKLLFPQMSDSRPSLLGLGDIVIPGIFIALILRFDEKLHQEKISKNNNNNNDEKKSNRSILSFIIEQYQASPYFYTLLFWYSVGLTTTIMVMYFFQHAQPALLYLVPACIGSTIIQSLIRKQFKLLWNYSEVKEEQQSQQQQNDKKTN